MDKVDQDVESRIKIIERPLITEKLDTTPHHPINFPNGKTVQFGNTGLSINFNMPRYNFDFLPENNMGGFWDQKKQTKYASMLGAAFLRLHSLLNDPEGLTKLGIDDSDVGSISAPTNDRLINAIDSLFSRSETPGLTSNHTEIETKIDLRGFRELTNDDPLIKYLERVSERAKDMTVTYPKEVEKL